MKFRIKEKVYQYIRNKLLSGDIKPGEIIRKDLIAEAIFQSRTHSQRSY